MKKGDDLLRSGRLRQVGASARAAAFSLLLAAAPNVVSGDALIGTWRKRPGDPCAARYPQVLTFLPGGHYRGAADPPGEFTWWDVGRWELRGPGEVALSTANDAVRGYRFVLTGSELRFTDPEGCRFTYEAEKF